MLQLIHQMFFHVNILDLWYGMLINETFLDKVEFLLNLPIIPLRAASFMFMLTYLSAKPVHNCCTAVSMGSEQHRIRSTT